MRPVLIDQEAMPQKLHFALFARAPQVDDASVRIGLKVELPESRKGPASGSLLDAAIGMTAVGCDVPSRLELQSDQGLVMEALPNFGLPATIKTFNGSLKPGFPRRGKDGGNTKLRHSRITRPMLSAKR